MDLYKYFYSINNATFSTLKSMASSPLDGIAAFIVESYLFILPLLLLFFIYKKDRNAYPYFFGLIISYTISYILKTIFREPRPCNIDTYNWINKIGCESGYSFPSSHATVLTGIVIFMKPYRIIRALYIIWLFFVLLFKIYLGEHFLSDIIFGMLLSIVIYYAIYRYREKLTNFIISLPIIKKIDTVLFRNTGKI